MTKVYCDNSLECRFNEYGACQRDKINIVNGECAEWKEAPTKMICPCIHYQEKVAIPRIEKEMEREWIEKEAPQK